ncbi:MAG: efflux transporter outer membrane subunit [Acidobacteriota bacterium]
MTRVATVIVVGALTAGCTVGPHYTRPAIEMPAAYRDGAAPGTGTSADSALTDTKWFDLFNDDVLTGLVKTALERNADVRMAAERVLQARERFRISTADRLPAVDAGVSGTANRRSEIGAAVVPPGAPRQIESVRAAFSVGWEVDVWGRVRRLEESAKARYLATEDARRGVLTTLVADVSQTYLTLRSLDAQLEIAQRTRGLAANGYRLTDLRRARGVATGLDVRQAEQLQLTVDGQIIGLQRAIAQTENALSVLLGMAPGEIARGQALASLPMPPLVPAGLPSSLLERRPDIRQAEQELVAANAEIGVARAQFFPRISLTGVLGVESRSLSDLLSGRAGLFTLTGQAVGPIFNGGRNRANLRLAESVQRELVVNYEQSIHQALREVSDALVSSRATAEQRDTQGKLVASLREASRLSLQRYQGGLDSYLQVLDAQRTLFQSELGLAALQQQALGSVVELYRALGGGWIEGATAPTP